MTQDRNLRFGFQVTAARQLARLSQAAFARRAGIDVITLRRIEATGELPSTARKYSIQAIERALANTGAILLVDGRSELIYPIGRLSGPVAFSNRFPAQTRL